MTGIIEVNFGGHTHKINVVDIREGGEKNSLTALIKLNGNSSERETKILEISLGGFRKIALMNRRQLNPNKVSIC